MAEYIYLPVPTKEMIEFANKFKDARLKKTNTDVGILKNYFVSGMLKGVSRHLFGGCLRAVHQGDSLFLILHGAGVAGSRFIGAKRNGGQKKYTPEQIARTIEKEGLPKSFEDLFLLSCGGGLDVDDGGRLHKPFVAKVSAALKDLGYSRIRVTGYMGDVKPGCGDGYQVVVDTGLGLELVDEDLARVTVM